MHDSVLCKMTAFVDREPDTVQTTRAHVDVIGNEIVVWATSDDPDAILNVSIDDLNDPNDPNDPDNHETDPYPETMIPNPAMGRHEFSTSGSSADINKIVTVSSNLGGVYNTTLISSTL